MNVIRLFVDPFIDDLLIKIRVFGNNHKQIDPSSAPLHQMKKFRHERVEDASGKRTDIQYDIRESLEVIYRPEYLRGGAGTDSTTVRAPHFHDLGFMSV